MSRILLIECDDSEKWKGLTLSCFQQLLGRPGDDWKGAIHGMQLTWDVRMSHTHTHARAHRHIVYVCVVCVRVRVRAWTQEVPHCAYSNPDSNLSLQIPYQKLQMTSSSCCFYLQVFSVPKHEFPTQDDVRQAGLVILGGGKYSANGEEEWMKKLLSPDCLPAWVQTGHPAQRACCCRGVVSLSDYHSIKEHCCMLDLELTATSHHHSQTMCTVSKLAAARA
eukprot:1160793-Pelagomonas_calceolata.AAC.10